MDIHVPHRCNNIQDEVATTRDPGGIPSGSGDRDAVNTEVGSNQTVRTVGLLSTLGGEIAALSSPMKNTGGKADKLAFDSMLRRSSRAEACCLQERSRNAKPSRPIS
jgi:hypothetical protein